MNSKKSPKPLKTKRHVVELAGIAFRELSLPGSLHSKADEARLWRMYRGLTYLDEQLGEWKVKLDNFLERYALDKDVKRLVTGLHTLILPVNEEAAKDYEKDVVKIPWEEALRVVKGEMRHIEDFDEDKVRTLVEFLTDRPVRLTTLKPHK